MLGEEMSLGNLGLGLVFAVLGICSIFKEIHGDVQQERLKSKGFGRSRNAPFLFYKSNTYQKGYSFYKGIME